MSRTSIIVVVLLLVIVAVLFGLSSINSEVPLTPVEQPVTNVASPK